MKQYIIPYGVALVFSSLSGEHFHINDSYAYRPDLVVESLKKPSCRLELAYNELSSVSPLVFKPSTLYHIPSVRFDAMFLRKL